MNKGFLFRYIKLQLITIGEKVLKINKEGEKVFVSVDTNDIPSYNNALYSTISSLVRAITEKTQKRCWSKILYNNIPLPKLLHQSYNNRIALENLPVGYQQWIQIIKEWVSLRFMFEMRGIYITIFFNTCVFMLIILRGYSK